MHYANQMSLLILICINKLPESVIRDPQTYTVQLGRPLSPGPGFAFRVRLTCMVFWAASSVILNELYLGVIMLLILSS